MVDKYKKEIEEILEQAGEATNVQQEKQHWEELSPSLSGLLWLYASKCARNKIRSVRSGSTMVMGVVFIGLALVLGRIIPGLGIALGVGGILLFLLSYSVFFIRPNKAEKRWRGQVIRPNLSWWKRLRNKRR